MQATHSDPLLVRKYDQALPRYTSYPTIPCWNNNLSANDWMAHVAKNFSEQNPLTGISLYVHLPFCESLCTYCGCNKKITTNHDVEQRYMQALLKECKIYRNQMDQTPIIRELHLGGGTPTFFSPKHLKELIQALLKNCIVHPDHEFSVEGHPGNTTEAHLRILYSLGFRRISFGIQDNDAEVQKIINRIQPFEQVVHIIEQARAIGFESVNVDLIYGLPRQTRASIEKTIQQVISLRPDRIAFYSYAHVPWTSKAQRLFDETDLPSAEEKIQLYLKGKELLLAAGYSDIGMDHFALPGDKLFQAWKKGKLHRNFMGYTTQSTSFLLGLGVSAISDIGDAYMQNSKSLTNYYRKIEAGESAIEKGHQLSEIDAIIKKYILEISCKGHTVFKKEHLSMLREQVFPKLPALEKDGLIEWSEENLQLTAQGRYFIRKVCSCFDQYLDIRNSAPQSQVFSQAI